MKEKIFILVAMIIAPLAGISQQFLSNNQMLIKDAITGGLVVVEQTYQLQDTATNQLFGRNNQPEFGRAIALGVKCEKGVIVPEKLKQPWAYDTDFERYRGRYNGVLSDMQIRDINDNVSLQKQRVESVEYSTLTPSVNCVCTSSAGLKNTFPVGSLDSNNSDGWVVWLSGSNNISAIDSSTVLNYHIYKCKLPFDKDSVRYKVSKPITNGDIWGGIYINTIVTSPGHIEVRLFGCIYEIQGEWYIVPLKNTTSGDAETAAAVEDNAEETEDSLTLTPISEVKEDSKEKDSGEDTKKKNGSKKKGNSKKKDDSKKGDDSEKNDDTKDIDASKKKEDTKNDEDSQNVEDDSKVKEETKKNNRNEEN